MNQDLPILIIGAGSIGERHIRNLWALGYRNLHVYRQRNLPFRDIRGAHVNIILTWKGVLKINPFAAIICTPTSQHLQQCINCIRSDMHVLVEKPLSHNTEHFDTLRKEAEAKNKLLHVAYMMRFHPFMKEIKNFIGKGTYGNLISFHTYWGTYLPNWHPYEDYRKSYAARRDLGGGAALTLSHDMDLINWLVNTELKKYSAALNYNSKLEIDVESGADFLLEFENRISGQVHVNFHQQSETRRYEFHFDKVSLEINYFQNEMKIITRDDMKIDVLDNFERNHLYIDEIKYFFELANSEIDLTISSLQQIDESELIIEMCRNSLLKFESSDLTG